MELVGKLIVTGPYAMVRNLTKGRNELARSMCLAWQLEEDPWTSPLPYNEDPLYVVPEAVVVEAGVTMCLWTGGDGCDYAVAAYQCYDPEHPDGPRQITN